MTRAEQEFTDPAVLRIGLTPPATSERGTARRFSLPLSAMLVYAAIRLLSLAVAWFLLPRGRFAALHYSVAHLIQTWDSSWYLAIAAHGYSYVPGNLDHDRPFAWFPGYPAAIDAIGWLTGAVQAGFIVTTIAGLVAAWGLARLGMLLTGDSRVGLLLAALWAVAPGSIVLSMLYAEALFCALAVWSLIALAERRWLTAALLVILAGTVRSTAMALVAAVAVAALPALISAARARAPFTVWWRPTAAVLLAPLGLLGYWGFMAWAWHRADAWFWLEHELHNGFDWGRAALAAVSEAAMAGPSYSSTATALTVLVLAAAVLLTGWSLAVRMPWCLHAYTLVMVVTAIATGPYYLGSKPRYLLSAMLLGLPLARLLASARTWVLVPLIAVLAAASTWFSLYLMSIHWAP